MTYLQDFIRLLNLWEFSNEYKNITKKNPILINYIKEYKSNSNYKQISIEMAFNKIINNYKNIVYSINNNTINLQPYTKHIGGFINASAGSSLSNPFNHNEHYSIHG
jgi:hypothetical protein